jgi:hypothetical protein
MWFVITKAHHAPMFTDSVPVYLDDAIVELLAVDLEPGNREIHFAIHVNMRMVHNTPFPLIVTNVQRVPGFIPGIRTLTSAPDVKRKNGFCVKIRLVW